ncbi:LysR substrate-binding domain-containing protein [Marinovum sp. 2_MG-2023]|uniref:LysR substrate-binding domain-containing protein n=1 Tax=unclassified Marinovum TaxID=2647166 RepID=UPI0026E411C6|nr:MULTISPECIES: LysR substrate-binding domain-containing protein [unclassified Marinovum]MDO6732891.1 LysR substrate-binding domain-containing protein [Marinovum sp. 2_MG-2023]MDO6782179.1 LysR substrate-binding domain-containing protein [Marinovum sp. 1_MG-2023]
MNLSFRQLRTFREVMRFGSVSEAARTLARSQPSVSAMIANLEQELGFDLFQRHKGRMVPKPEAHYFLEEVEIVLDRLAQSTRTMREIGDLDKGQLRIACMPAASGFFLPRVLANFVESRPHVTASLVTRTSYIVEELIASQQYDIGLSETPHARDTIGVTSFDLKCVCAVHRDHPLSAKTMITPRDLDGLPIAALTRDHPISIKTKRAFEDAGANLFQRFELQIFQPALELVEGQLCHCICDPISAESYKIYRPENPKIIFVPFSPAIEISTSILTPSQRPKSLLGVAFEEQIVAAMKGLQSQ